MNKIAAAVLLHIALSTLAAMGLGLAWGHLNAVVSSVSLGLGALAACLLVRKMEDRKGEEVKFLAWLFYAFILFAGFQHFLHLLYYDHGSLKTLHPNNYGDLPMHIQYIRSFGSGARFWPADPGFSGTLLRYPIGMDLYNALWEELGVPLETHLFATGLVMTGVAVAVLHSWMGWWGVGAFFLNGGLFNWESVFSLRLEDLQNTAAWKNFLLSLWITQRGFLFAIPAGAYVLRVATDMITRDRSPAPAEKAVFALLWSALAYFHTHSFFIISIIIILLLRRELKSMSLILFPVAASGAAFVLFATDFFSHSGVLRIQWGWVAGEANFFKFWLLNLGPWIPLWGITIYFLFSAGDPARPGRPPSSEDRASFRRLRPAAAIFFLSFFLFTFVMTAPWSWDNIKVLVWPYLLLAWVVRRVLISRLSPVLSAIIGCIVFLPGAISVMSSLPGNGRAVELYRSAELYESKAAIAALPVGAVLAIAPAPNHPVMYWGARVAVGYPGHLWSHGISYEKRLQELEEIFEARGDWLALARNMGVTHICWGEEEKSKYGAFEQPWRKELKDVSRSRNVQIYELPK